MAFSCRVTSPGVSHVVHSPLVAETLATHTNCDTCVNLRRTTLHKWVAALHLKPLLSYSTGMGVANWFQRVSMGLPLKDVAEAGAQVAPARMFPLTAYRETLSLQSQAALDSFKTC